jgi:ribokinase
MIVDYDETLRCTGIRPSDQEKCMKACISLMKRVKSKYVVILLEGRGCFLYDGTYYDFIPAYDVPGLSGADVSKAFTTALVSEYLKAEGDIRRACDFATIVTALYLTRGGGLRAYPRLEDVKRFVVKNELDFSFE